MTMTNEEIVRDYLGAKDPKKQIRILADLNGCKPSEIAQILLDAGKLSAQSAGQFKRNEAAAETINRKNKAKAAAAKEKKAKEPDKLFDDFVKEIVREWMTEHAEDFEKAKAFISLYQEAKKWLA